VEVGSADEGAQYRRFVDDYVSGQKGLGRFPQPANNRLRTVAQWLRAQHAVSSDIQLQTLLSFAFLAVCLINTAGLLLARFLSRVREVSVHRALGATRNQIFLRYLAEAGVIGLCGSLIGLVLTFAGSAVMQWLAPELDRVKLVDPQLIGATVLLAIAVSLAAGAIPAWRVCRTVPATFLKSE
jgi:putative ABC transport system permease protein